MGGLPHLTVNQMWKISYQEIVLFIQRLLTQIKVENSIGQLN